MIGGRFRVGWAHTDIHQSDPAGISPRQMIGWHLRQFVGPLQITITAGDLMIAGPNEGQISTRKWKDEQSGQDKYSTEILIQGYNSSLTMLGGGSSGSIQNDKTPPSSKDFDDSSQANDMDDEIPF